MRYAALLFGAIPVLAFPSLDLEYLAWIGLIPGLLLLRAAPSGREATVRGWWFGTGYLLAALYWLTPNLGPGLLVVVIVLGLPWAGVGYAAWRLLRSPQSQQPGWNAGGGAGANDAESAPSTATTSTGRTRNSGAASLFSRLLGPPGPNLRQSMAACVVLPSCWVVIDWIRSWQGIGGPWAVFGASQWQHPTVLALAAVGGIWLVSFALVAANTGIVVALTSPGRLGRALGALCALLAIAAGPAAFWLTSAQYAGPPARRLSVGLVQPGITKSPHQTYAEEVRFTRGLRGVDLVVWGESSVSSDLATDHAVLAQLKALSATVGAQILVSEDADNPAGDHIKVAVLIGRHGIEGTYVKSRLVPFGEYIPFRSALGWLTSVSRAASTNMAPGPGAHVLHATLPDGHKLTIGVLICFESSFPDMSRVDTSHGARVIIYQTSDSTFEGSWAPEQHASLAAIRAAETGRPVVQAALTGDSAGFDDRGRLLAWADTAYRGVVRVTLALPRASARTLFDRYGDFVPWFAIAITAIAIVSAVMTGRAGRPRRHTGELRSTRLARQYRRTPCGEKKSERSC